MASHNNLNYFCPIPKVQLLIEDWMFQSALLIQHCSILRAFKSHFLRDSSIGQSTVAPENFYFLKSMKIGGEVRPSDVRLSVITVFSKKILPP